MPFSKSFCTNCLYTVCSTCIVSQLHTVYKYVLIVCFLESKEQLCLPKRNVYILNFRSRINNRHVLPHDAILQLWCTSHLWARSKGTTALVNKWNLWALIQVCGVTVVLLYHWGRKLWSVINIVCSFMALIIFYFVFEIPVQCYK